MCRSVHFKTIAFLIKSGNGHTVASISKAINISHARVLEVVKELEKMGMVRVTKIGRMNYVVLNRDDPRVKAIEHLITVFEEAEKAEKQGEDG